MDILFPVGRISVTRSSYHCSIPSSHSSPLSSDPPSSSPCSPSSSFRTRCSRGSSQQPSDGADNGENNKEKPDEVRDEQLPCSLHETLSNKDLISSWLFLVVKTPGLGNKKSSMDWDKAWTNFRNQGRKRPSSKFSPNKYVTWNPRRSNYPLSEEVDPIKRSERSNLMLWTSPSFTLGGAIVIVSLLLVYTLLAPMK